MFKLLAIKKLENTDKSFYGGFVKTTEWFSKIKQKLLCLQVQRDIFCLN